MALLDKAREVKNKEINALEGNKVITEANLLLNAAQEEDTKILKELGLDHFISFKEEKEHNINALRVNESIYQTESFSGQQIKDLCITYNLKILPISKYNGKIPNDLVFAIKDFIKKNEKNKVMLNREHFFILAPVESFKLSRHKEPVPQPVDPIVFYREPQDNWERRQKIHEDDVLNTIHSWGNDFTFFRKLRFLSSTSETSGASTLTKSTLALIFLVVAFFANMVAFVPAFIFTIISGSIIYNLFFKEQKIDELWNIASK